MTNEFKGLRHYIDIVESKDQQVDEEGIMNALGQLGGAVAGTGVNAVKGIGNAVSGAYDAAKQGVAGAVDAAGNAISGAVAPVVQGAKQGYASATGAPAPTQQAAAKPQAGQSASPKPAAKPAAKADPNVKALQDKLIAAGAKIKADGIMGPATRAAQAQFPNVTTQTGAEQAAASAPGAAPATAAELGAGANGAAAAMASQSAPASNATANTTGGPANMGAPAATPDNSQVATDDIPFDPTWGGTKAAPDTRTAAEKFLPNFLGGKAAPTAANKNATWNNAQQAAVSNPAGTAMAESAGYDELQRIVSLVHHR
jgi:hypothetical protein